MKEHAITGIVLHSKDMFEKDKIVDLFTEKEGKIQILAKYANTKSFKFGGKLDPGNIIHCQLYAGKSFAILTQCDLIQKFPLIRTSYNKISLMMYMFDIIRLSTSYQQENMILYELLHYTLQVLDEKNLDIHAVQHDFETRYLKGEGLLSQENTLKDHSQFKHIFDEYSGKFCRSPQFLIQKS
jgi:DNA repair protein RecO (recombination protein O)